MDETLSSILRTGLLSSQERDEESSRFLGIIGRCAELFSFQSEEPAEDRILKELARIIIEETDFENCSIVLWDPGADHLSLKAAYGLDDLLGSGTVGNRHRDLAFDVGEGIAGRVFQMRSPFFLENAVSDPLPPKRGATVAPISLVCLPLNDLGVMNISSAQPRCFSSQTRRNWELISRIISFLLGGALASRGPGQARLPISPDLKNGKSHSHSAEREPAQDLPLPQQALESTPQGICLLDSIGAIVQVNQSIERRHGLSASQLKGRSPAILFASPSEFEKLFREVSAFQAQELTNVSMMTREGESYPADVNLVRLLGESGTTSGFLLVIHDMTKRNVLAEKLIQTEKLAALGTMAGGVAHDFNNLLMAILGNIQLMLPAIADDEIQRRLHNIEKAVQDGASTVRRLQKFTERSRDSQMPAASVDVAEAINDVIELTRPRWKNAMERSGRSIRFELSLAPACFASISASDLREVLTNLVFNAVEAMPEGGVITLSCRESGDQILLEVSDTGVGMTKEVSGRIFDPFYTTKGVGNSGLGLSVSWSLIARSGGEIRARSAPGRGSAFEISLPKASPLPGASVSCRSPSTPRFFRLLIVDDDPEILEILRDMLRLKGHRVTATADGHEALRLIDAEHFDLVLTDLGMPSVSGWDIARRAKARSPKLPVILITGWGAQYEEDDLTASGVDHVLSKPLSWDRLLEAVTDSLNPVITESTGPRSILHIA
ncbi:MAG: response regulator [Syntrophobacteraceae bacterium]|jgi:PAS domain S-box-containing protein|nr:response regulator [Syntrophobacteraceae bacterium]